MNNDINLSEVKTDYQYCKDIYRTIICKKLCKFFIYGREYFISKHGTARCNPKDSYNQEFGKALAWTRASKKIGNEVENILISVSAQHSTLSNKNKEIKKTNDLVEGINKVFNLMSDFATAMEKKLKDLR